jgi:aryl-alcohol dehydrogenase-like predicted oxidoreductase
MMMRRIGAIPVSLAGLGCNNFGRRIDETAAGRVVAAALEAGVTTFDTADLYGDGFSEEYLGRALGARRDDAVIVTKFGMRQPPDGLAPGSAAWVARACEESLRRLGTDRIDVYLLHTPDPSTPIGETLTAMSELIRQGKVREIGLSNADAQQIGEAAEAARSLGVAGFSVLQNEYNLLHPEPESEVLPACGRDSITFMPYFPLASGLLTGKYKVGEPPPPGSRLAGDLDDLGDEVLKDVERLAGWADERGHTLLELSLSWLACEPLVCTVIAGATKPEQVAANAAATLAWQMSPQEREEARGLLR